MSWSGTGEFDDCGEIAGVGLSQRGEVVRSNRIILAGDRRTAGRPSPGKPGPAERGHEQIGGHPRMTPVAVGKWMDGNQPVMEFHTHSVPDAVIPCAIAPELRVLDEVPNRFSDLEMLNADIRRAHSVPTGPSPDVAEHLPMETAEETVVENLMHRSGSARRPEVACADVGLFGRVQFTSGAYVRQPQIPELVVVDCSPSTIAVGPALAAQPTTRTRDGENR